MNQNDYTLNGTTLTLDEAPPSGRKIVVYSVRAAVSGSNLNHDQFTCNGNSSGNLGTEFTLSIAPVSENNTQVFLDGVYQQKTDYSVSGTTLTMDTAPSAGAILEVMTFTQTDINVPVNDTIDTVHLKTDAVTTAKITDANVTRAKIAADAIDATKLADGAVSEEHLDPTIISGLTAATPVSGDSIMFLDATDSALKKADVNEIMATAVSITSAAEAVAMSFDSSENTTFTGQVTANAGVVVDNITIDGQEIDVSSGDLTLDVAGDINLDAAGGQLNFKDSGTTRVTFELDATPEVSFTGGNLAFNNLTQNADIAFKGFDDSSFITALNLDMSAAGAATFNAGVTATAVTVGNTTIGSNTSHFPNLTINNNAYIGSTSATTAIQIDSSGNPVFKGANHTNLQVKSGDDSVVAFIQTVQGTDARFGTSTNHPVNFAQNGAFRLTLDTNGNTAIAGLLGVNKAVNTAVALSVGADSTATNSYGLEVTNASANTRFLVDGVGSSFFYKTDNALGMKFDASTGHVGIGATSVFSKLHVEDTGWSSGSPYGTVAYILGGNVNDDNWGHVLISQDSTATGSGGKLSFGSNGDNPIAGIKAFYAGATFGHLDFYTRPSGGTSTQRMRIRSDGNVGIGSSGMPVFSGYAQLSIGPMAHFMAEKTSGTSRSLHISQNAHLDADGSWETMETDEASNYYQTNGTHNFRVASSTSAGTDISWTTALQLTSVGQLVLPVVKGDTTSDAANLNIRTSDGLVRRSTSSRRYKNTITDATHGLTELLGLRPVTYKGNSDGDRLFGGLIAEEVHDAGLTEFVQYNSDDEPDALAYGHMVSLCIKAIQEQQALIETLQAEVEALKNG